MSASFTTRLVLHPGALLPVEVHGQNSSFDGSRILSFTVGDFDHGRVVVQGDPADILAFVDRVRDALVAEVGRVWPVEQAHAAVGA